VLFWSLTQGATILIDLCFSVEPDYWRVSTKPKISQSFLFFESQERTRQRIIEISKGIIHPIRKTLRNTKWCIENQYYFKMTNEKQIITNCEKTEKYLDGEVLIVVSTINPHAETFSKGYYCSAKHLLNYSDDVLKNKLDKLRDYNKKYNDFIEKLDKLIPEDIIPVFTEFKSYCSSLPLCFESSGSDSRLSDPSFLHVLSLAFNQTKTIAKGDQAYRLYSVNGENIIQWVQNNSTFSDYLKSYEQEIKSFLLLIDEYTEFLDEIISEWKDIYSMSESEIQEYIQVPINYHCRLEDR